MKLWEFRGKRRGWDIARAQSTMGRANFGSSEGEGHEVVSACVCVCVCLCPLWWALCACLCSWGCCHTQLIKTSKVNNMKLKPFTDVTSYQITSRPLRMLIEMFVLQKKKKHRGLSNFRGSNKPMTQCCLCACCWGNPDSQKEWQQGDMMSGWSDRIGQWLCVEQYHTFLCWTP